MTEPGAHRLGDVLREAREGRGLDLVRVERETKIRERYLSALERGEYRELPGSVYTRGFLRNYGAYLGLDPEDLIDLYRIETTTAVERPRVPMSPRPLAGRRNRAFVVTPGAIVGAILTVLVGAFIAYLAFELVNFARTPELRITDPPGPVSGHTEMEITIRGVTAPNATVVVGNLRENPTVVADADGNFEVVVGLVPGSNIVELTARDPQTGRDSPTESRRILVVTDDGASPTPGGVALTVEEPAADDTFTRTVPVSGTAAPDATVRAEANLVEAAAPSFSVADAAGATVEIDPSPPSAPEPIALTADGSGAFEGSIALAPGSWELTIGTDGSDPEVRIVTVRPGDGLRATLRLRDGDSYLELEEDGVAVAGQSGGIAADGDRIQLRASDELRIRAGNAGAVRVTINGIRIGAMGSPGAVVEWRITPLDD